MMKKQEAINIFGTKQKEMADALGKSKSAISQWGDDLTSEQINLVLGAALRSGKKIPGKFIKAA
jgi:DNA-binding XRE family transcriptional regulator